MLKNHEDLVESQFGERARNYVESAVHASGEDLRRIEEIARLGSFELALDLGCGGGHITYALAPHVRGVVASDLSARMLEAVREETMRRGFTNVEFRQAQAEQLPFDQGVFDLVVSRYSAHHWRDWETGLREVRRITKPGGRIIFADVMAPEASALDTHLQAVELLRDPSHVRDYAFSEWRAALRRANITSKSFHTGRLTLEFSSWVERMATPDVSRRAIRWLQSGAAEEIKKAFEIAADGSFVVDIVLIEAEPST